MKKLLFIAIITAFVACTKEDVTPDVVKNNIVTPSDYRLYKDYYYQVTDPVYGKRESKFSLDSSEKRWILLYSEDSSHGFLGAPPLPTYRHNKDTLIISGYKPQFGVTYVNVFGNGTYIITYKHGPDTLELNRNGLIFKCQVNKQLTGNAKATY